MADTGTSPDGSLLQGPEPVPGSWLSRWSAIVGIVGLLVGLWPLLAMLMFVQTGADAFGEWFVLMILSVLLVAAAGLAALILGVVGLARLRRRHVRRGRLAALGIATGIGCLLVLYPSWQVCRAAAYRYVCATNLAAIHYGLEVYLNWYKGAYPPDMQALVAERCIDVAMQTCPAVRGSDPHAAYEYIPGPHEQRPGVVLIYEPPGHHHADGGFVLFEDGHPRWIQPYSQVLEMVEQTKQQLAGQQVTASQ